MIKLGPLLLICFLLLQGCGYQSVHKIKRENFSIIKFEISGNENISRDLTRNFEKFKIMENNKYKYELISNSQINKKVRSRNSKGVAENLSLNILIQIIIKENGVTIGNKSFKENSNYANSENKFSLSQYEKVITKGLTKKIINRINFYIANIQ